MQASCNAKLSLVIRHVPVWNFVGMITFSKNITASQCFVTAITALKFVNFKSLSKKNKKKHFSIEQYILSNTSLGNPAPCVFLWDIKNRNGTTDNFCGFWNHDFCQTVVYLETFKKINIK